MTSREPDSLPLPSETQLFWAPERAILALLDANLLLAARVLNAAHPEFNETDEPSDVPLLVLERSIIATSASLRQLIAGYDDIVDRMQPASTSCGQPPSQDDEDRCY